MPESGKEVVLITGGSGFLGQHLIRELQEHDPNVLEIRSLDLKPYVNHLNHEESKPFKSIIGDICDVESIQEIFAGVTSVFHCAAFISYEFPPNKTELERVNVQGTKNIIQLCINNNVERLVYTSTTEVTLIPYLQRGTFSIIVNQTESKAQTPAIDNGFVIPGFPATKLRAEKLVLSSNGAPLKNGGILKTVALRPTFMYGEQDKWFITTCLKIAYDRDGELPKFAGPGGKQQVIYAGNAAWAHVCAMKSLKENAEGVSGLPVFVTDDTPVEDMGRFCARLSRISNPHDACYPSWWSIPALLSYFVAFIIELCFLVIHPVLGIRLPFAPKSVISYLGSIILYNRLRAVLHMKYNPYYSEELSLKLSGQYYTRDKLLGLKTG